MDEYKRHKRVFAFFRWLISPFIRWKFNYSFDDLSHIDAPYLLLANHNLDYDPILIGIAAKRQLYFVASEHVTRAGIWSKLLMRYLKPIIRTKGKAGSRASMEILRTLKNGHSVCLFPEGNRSFNGLTGEIPAATGKLARRSGAKLVTFRIQGGYFSQPRWGHSLRRGKLKGSLMNVYTVEQLKSMSDEQVYSAICSDLYEDAYATQEKEQVDFRGKAPAFGLETTLFSCPLCGKFSTLSSAGSTLSCAACAFSAEYTPRGMLRFSDGSQHSVTELDAMQRHRLTELVSSGSASDILFSDQISINEIGASHEVVKTEQGLLSASLTGFIFNGQLFPPKNIFGAAIYGRNTIVVHIGADLVHYEIKGANNFSALKYLYLYNILNNGEEK